MVVTVAPPPREAILGDNRLVIESRGGCTLRVASSARVAATARLVGNVIVSEECAIDAGAVITSSGPAVELDRGVVVTPNAVIRAVGGDHRPAFGVRIGADCVIGPAAVWTGCQLGEAVYVATAVLVFQGARVGAGSRLGAGSIVHTAAVLAPRTRVGMRQIAVATDTGAVITSDVDLGRRHLAEIDFFGRVFDADDADQLALHRRSAALLRREADDWN